MQVALHGHLAHNAEALNNQGSVLNEKIQAGQLPTPLFGCKQEITKAAAADSAASQWTNTVSSNNALP